MSFPGNRAAKIGPLLSEGRGEGKKEKDYRLHCHLEVRSPYTALKLGHLPSQLYIVPGDRTGIGPLFRRYFDEGKGGKEGKRGWNSITLGSSSWLSGTRPPYSEKKRDLILGAERKRTNRKESELHPKKKPERNR